MGLLPGQRIVNGASNLAFGSNVPNFNPQFLNTSQIQSQFKSLGITVMRFPMLDGSNNPLSNAQLDQFMNACATVGCVPLVILSHSNMSANLHAVQYLGTRCMLYEFTNEPDNIGVSVATYTSLWNAEIPKYRNVNPHAAYIGPTLASLNVSFLGTWLDSCKQSGVLPDAISFHNYPCGSQPSQAQCSTMAGNLGSSVTSCRNLIQQHLGYSLPVCLTEWNIDWHSIRVSYNKDATFVNTWSIAALESLVSANCDMACQFHDGDIISNTAPYPQNIFYPPLATEIKKYLGGAGSGTGTGGGGGTGTTSGVTASPTSLSFSGVVNGSASSQNTTITNNGTAGTLSAPIAYSDNASLNWVSVATASTLGGGGTTASATITCTPVSGLPAGTHTATVTFTVSGQSVVVNVTYTVTGGSNTAQHILAPAYSSPTDSNGSWTQYENAGTAVGFIVANPNSGPGTSQSSTFVNGIAAMHAKGIKVLGYVWTNTANVSIASVESQIDQWYSWYNIDGIHLDDALCNSANLSYYTTLFNYIRGKDSVRNYVFLNPASVPPENYMPILDTVLIYENNYGGTITTQPYMQNYPASKFGATVLNLSTTAQVDTTMSALKSANVGFVFLTDQSGASPYFAAPNTTIWNETLAKLGTATTGGGGGTTGGSTATTPLSLYFAAAADTTISTANQLYTIGGATTPPTTWAYTRLGVSTGFGEVVPQTETGAWEALTTIGSPSGEGFLYESTALEGNQINAGNWSAQVRLNCAQSGDTNSQAGTVTGDIYVRAFKRSSSGTYTQIVSMSLLNQTIPSAYTTFQLPNVATSTATAFTTGDKLYLDIWVNVTNNTNNSSVQDIRLSRLSTDTTGLTGDSGNAVIVTPGFTATTTSSGNATITVSTTSLVFSAVQGGSITPAQNVTLTNSGAASGSWTESISYTQGSGWLALGTTSGTLTAGATQSVSCACDPTGLAPGTYNASVIFSMNGTTANVAVTFTVSSPSAAFLSVSPTSLNFSVTR